VRTFCVRVRVWRESALATRGFRPSGMPTITTWKAYLSNGVVPAQVSPFIIHIAVTSFACAMGKVTFASNEPYATTVSHSAV